VRIKHVMSGSDRLYHVSLGYVRLCRVNSSQFWIDQVISGYVCLVLIKQDCQVRLR